MKKLLFLVSAMAVSACLAQDNSKKQDAAYSNIGAYVQEGSAPANTIAAYEVTIDDLLNTPWHPSSAKVKLYWDSIDDFDGAQLLESLNITLEKGQDLVIHLANSEGVLNRGVATQTGEGLETGEIEYCMATLNYGGWRHFLSPTDQYPLSDLNGNWKPIKNEQEIVYHFYNSHAGITRLEFAYCIDDHGRMNNNRCSNHGKKINVKNIFVTTK